MTIWEKLYKDKKHLSVWPWSNVISLTNRHLKKKNKKNKVLEIGCGFGANIPFFNKKNYDYYGFDLSSYAINFLKRKFPKLKKKLFVLDIEEKDIPFRGFDLIIDRGCNPHILKKNNNLVIQRLTSSLKKNGIIIFTDLISKKTTLDKRYKIFNLDNFYSKKRIFKVFRKMKIVYMDEEKKDIYIPKKKRIVSWNVVVKKK